MNKLSLVQISNAISTQRELRDHQRVGIKCMCYNTGTKAEHESIYEANRW